MTTTLTTDTLKGQLDALAQQTASTAPAELFGAIGAGIEHLARSGIVHQSLQQGDVAPDFTLPDTTGDTVTLSRLLQRGPVVLTFYRGEWCPFCNLQLRAYQQALPAFERLGAILVAVSPQTPDYSLLSVQNKELTFPVLSDVGNQVARQYRLVYTLDEGTRRAYTSMGMDVPAHNGDDSWELPLAGTFVIGQDRVIRLAYVDANFMNRLEPDAVLDSLANLV